MLLPIASAYQTLENSQGTLDPLGMYSVSDRLALRLVPGLRERMTHPRFLTAIAVGNVICSEFEEETFAVDEVSEPWQIYEWIVVSAFVKHYGKEPNMLRGLPGREKTGRVLQDNLQLSNARYLKTASVFGFHGVYRTLCKNIRLMEGKHLGETGIRLIEVWEKEQDMEGFLLGKRDSNGGKFRYALQKAIDESLLKGEVNRTWTWNMIPTIAEKLIHSNAGPKELQLLFDIITRDKESGRTEIIRLLETSEGQDAIDTGSEKQFHEAFLPFSVHNQELIQAIQAYEAFARLLYNAFYQILQFLAESPNRKGSVVEFQRLDKVVAMAEGVKPAFRHVCEKLEPFTEEAAQFYEQFNSLTNFQNISELIELLIEHHFRIQKNKPPNGKASWLLEHSAGNYLLNTFQALDQFLSDEYVHQYRSYSLQSFLEDLKPTI